VELFGDKGGAVLLTPERLSGDNPAHVSVAQQVAERLGQAGLLGSLRPWPDS
jgi:hypothetical protein